MCLQVNKGFWNVATGTVLSLAITSHTGDTKLNAASYNGTNAAIKNNAFTITTAAKPNALVLNFDAKGELDLVTVVATCPDGSATVLASTMSKTSSGLIINLVGV